MTWRQEPPFRADHVGSLLRPPELLHARAEHAAGRIDADELRAAEDEAIRDAVRMQEAIGLQAASDGELRRASWHMDFIYQLGGVKKLASELAVEFHNPGGSIVFTPPSMRVDEPLRLDHTIFGDDFAFLRETVTTAVPKLTIPSPSMVHYRGGRAAIDETLYPDLDEFWADLTAAYREEVSRLGELGCATCSSTTRASPTSTTRSSASTWRRSAAIRSTSTRPTSAISTRPSRAGRRA